MITNLLIAGLNSPNREKRPRKQESLSEDEVADVSIKYRYWTLSRIEIDLLFHLLTKCNKTD